MTPTTEQLKDLLAKVTPGDWRVDHSYQWPGKIRSADSGRFICSSDPYVKGEPYGGIIQNSSNATLIALAPTLAAEVVRLRLHLSRMLMAQDGVPLNAIEFGKWVTEARQALSQE